MPIQARIQMSKLKWSCWCIQQNSVKNEMTLIVLYFILNLYVMLLINPWLVAGGGVFQ